VGIIERTQEIRGVFHGSYELPNSVRLQGQFTVHGESNTLVLTDGDGVEVIRGARISLPRVDQSDMHAAQCSHRYSLSLGAKRRSNIRR